MGWNGSKLWTQISNQEVMDATGCPKLAVELYWPAVRDALYDANIGHRLVQVGAVATIAIETARTFKPIREYATGDAYEGREDLGNNQPGDGKRFKGRGFIQLTGRSNYRFYGKQLGIDLEANPDRALEAVVASKIFAAYFKGRGIDKACMAHQWKRVRKLVNGGYNGLAAFMEIIVKLHPEDV